MEGWLYVMSNESLKPGLIKVGQTNDLRQHKQELYTAGVATPFTVAYRGMVEDCEATEKKVHNELEAYRLTPERDFFECSIAKAILTIQESTHIMSEEVYVKDENQFEEEQEQRKQKKLLSAHNEKLQKTRAQYVEDEGIWLDKPSFYVTVFLGLVTFIVFPEMDDYFKDNSAIKWFLVAIPPFIYWYFASRKYTRNCHDLSTKAAKLYPLAVSYEDIAPDSAVLNDSLGVDEGHQEVVAESAGELSARALRGKALDVGSPPSGELWVDGQSDKSGNKPVAQVTQATISWVCHYCATDNVSMPANQVVCIRCNKSSSMEDMW